ncbi:MAG: HlyC/CorC family transporter [Pseudomonadota bacterium]
MNDVSLSVLFAVLIGSLVVSAFFSSTETALMRLNRYRLRHRARSGVRSAKVAEALLSKPDRLIGLILLGNNVANVLAAFVVAAISQRLGGDLGTAIGAGVLVFVQLIFAEVAPKTLAALHPERIGMPAALVYYPLLKVFYPFVWLTNLLANGVLRLFGVRSSEVDGNALSHEELRTVVNEAGALISRKYRTMLTGILDLEKVTVDDVMVPHNDIIGIDLDDDLPRIVDIIGSSAHTRLPVYEDNIDQIVGVLHLRSLVRKGEQTALTKAFLRGAAREPYFVPEGTPLSVQLVQFQKRKARLALVVDEYGDIQGMVTLEDILEEIVGEFTTDPTDPNASLREDSDGSFIAPGAMTIRELNRQVGWSLPTDSGRTLNGLVQETLETIPDAGTIVEVSTYRIEILSSHDNRIVEARLTETAPAEGD